MPSKGFRGSVDALLDTLLGGLPRGPSQVEEKLPRETLGENVSGLHYGRCPRDKTLLKKRGSRVFCRRCGFTQRRRTPIPVKGELTNA